MKKLFVIILAIFLLAGIAGAQSDTDDEDVSEAKTAIEYFTNTLSLDPNNVTAYIERGNAYSKIGELNEAIQDFTEALRLDPNNVEAYVGRGNAYFFGEALDNAIVDLQAAFEIDGENTNIEFFLDLLLLMKGK